MPMPMFDVALADLGPFALVTVTLGGAAAWLAGRAVALTWRPWWQAVLYMFLLAGAIRFIHFALFDGALLSPAYALDSAITIGLATVAFRITRARQMATQYYFLAAPGRQSTPPARAAGP